MKILLPKPVRYVMTYQKLPNAIKDYLVSQPIAATPDSITVYSHKYQDKKPGIKTFLTKNIINMVSTG